MAKEKSDIEKKAYMLLAEENGRLRSELLTTRLNLSGLGKKVERLKAVLKEKDASIQRRNEQIKSDRVFIDELKTRFNRIKEGAQEVYQQHGTEDQDDDAHHYLFETAMESCLAKDLSDESIQAFWNAYNEKRGLA